MSETWTPEHEKALTEFGRVAGGHTTIIGGEVPDRLLALRRSVEYGKEKKCGTIVVNLELLDLLLRGELPVGGNELPPEEVTKRLYEVKAKCQDEMYLRGNQLAAISTVLKADTPISLSQVRLPADHALYTAAFQDAVAVMEKVIRLRNIDLQQRGVINVLADRLARWTGTTVPDEIRKAREVCIEQQAYADLAASGGIVDAP